MTLRYFPPGRRFRITEMPELTGVLIKVTDSRAVVRYDRPIEFRTFTDRRGRTRTLEVVHPTTDITPYVEVERV